MTAEITDTAVLRLVDASNAGDRDAFFAALTPDASMSDDGREPDLTAWVDKEISEDARISRFETGRA